MKFIKRLKHTDRELSCLNGYKIGWDIFWCRDYKEFDRIYGQGSDIQEIEEVRTKGIYGYTIIFAVNIWFIKFIKRFFIRIK